SRPMERILVRTVLPTAIGSGDVSSALSTLSSQRGLFLASATNWNTSSRGREIRTETLLVNIGSSLPAVGDVQKGLERLSFGGERGFFVGVDHDDVAGAVGMSHEGCS